VIAIDASALTKFLLKEEGWDVVIRYLRCGTISPDLVVKEAANAIWRRHVRGEITPETVKAMLKALKEIIGKAVKIEGEDEYLEEGLKIAFRQKITIYDSLYIALAKRKRLKLLTVDRFQTKAAKAEKVETVFIE